MASRNIQYKGSFDVSQILASFKQIRNEAEKSNISEKILGGYDKELEKVEKLTTQILAAQSRGLTDNLSIKEFARLVSQLEKQYGILNVKAQAFTDATSYKTETAEIKQYSTQLKALIDRLKSLEKSARDYIDANSDALKLSKEESKALKLSISDALAYKDVLDEIVEKRIEAAKAKVADRSLSTTGGALKYAEITGLSANFTLSAADKKGRDSSRKSLVNKNGNYDEAKALAVANEEYNRILEKSIAENKTAKEALEEMIKTMRAYKLELGDTDGVLKKFALDMASIKEAAWENHGNLTDSDKGAYTRAGNNVTKILNDALGLYNNADVGKVQLVAKEAEKTSSRMTAALHQLEQAIESTTEKEKELAEAAGKAAKDLIDGYKDTEQEATKYVSILDSIKNGFDSIGRGAKLILSVTTAWRSLRNVIKSTFNDVKALDKSFASIAMVTNYSVLDMWKQYNLYAEMANRLGQSTLSVVEASGLYYQQGLKTNEVLKLTEETMKLATLAGLDFKEATSQMTAALRAFHMDMDLGAHVTDVYAEVAAHAAVDVQGLSEAMSATAAIANSAGMSFENTTAMLATMVEATQEAPKNLGTAMKTILARFTELKTNVAGTADSEFEDLDYNKVDKALKSVGVNIKDATGLFRNMDDVLLELSGKWNTLDRNSQRYIATTAAGSRLQSRFIALMENYERTMELVNVAQNSAGRSSQLFAKYQDTVEYRVNKVKNSWELFRTSLLDSDGYKGALDLFSGFLDKLNEMSGTGLASLGITWLTAGRRAISGAIGGWSDLVGSVMTPKRGKTGDLLKKDEKILKQAQSANVDVENYSEVEAFEDKIYKQREAKAKSKGKKIGTILSTAITAAITAGVSSKNPFDAFVSAAISTGAALLPTLISIGMELGTAFGSALSGALAATGIGAIIVAITGLIAAGIGVISKWKQEAREALVGYLILLLEKEIEAVDQQIEKSKSLVKNYHDTLKTLEDIKEEYKDLNSKIVLTAEEQEKYNELIKTLREEYPELITYYDKENNKIQISNDLLDLKIEKISKLKKEESKVLHGQEVSKAILESRLDLKKALLEFENLFSDMSNNVKGRVTKYFVDPEKSDYYEWRSTKYGSTSEFYKTFKDNLFDVDKAIKAFGEDVFNKKELQEIRTILESSKDKLTSIDSHNEDIYAANKEYLDNTEPKLSETEKNIAAAMGVDQYNKKAEETRELSEQSADVENKESMSDYLNKLTDAFGTLTTEDNEKIVKDLNDVVNWRVGAEDDYFDLSETVRKTLKDYFGIKTEDDYKDFTDNGSISDAKFYKKAALRRLELELQEETNVDLDKNKDKIKNISNAIGDVNQNSDKLTIDEIKRRAELIKTQYADLGDYTKKIVDLSLNTDQIDKYTEKLKRFGLDSNETFTKATGLTMGAYDKVIDNLSSKFGDLIDPKKIGQSLSKITDFIKESNLTGDVQKAMFAFDPTSLDGKTKQEAIDYIKEIVGNEDTLGHLGKQDAQVFAEKFVNELQQGELANFDIRSVAGLDLAGAAIANQGKTIATAYKDVLSEVSNTLKNGSLDMFKKEDLEKNLKAMGLNPEDFIYLLDNGSYGIYYQDLQKAAEGRFKTEDLIRKELEQQIDEGIEQLTLEKLTLQSLLDKSDTLSELYTILHAITEEIANQQAMLTGASNLESYISNMGISLSAKELTSSDKEAIKKQIRDIDKTIEDLRGKKTDKSYIQKYIDDYQAWQNVVTSGGIEINKTIEDIQKQQEKANKDLIDKTKAVTEALKNLAKAIETVAEKLKELKAVIEGTNWKSSVDGMYNYNTALDFLTKQTERAKKKLEKVGSIAEAKNNFRIYGQGLLDLKAQLTAQNQTYRTAYNNIGKVYNNDVAKLINSFEDSNKMKFNLADYLTFDEKTGTKINMNALQKAKMPEALKKWIESLGLKANEYLGKILDNEDKIDLINEEFLEQQRKARDEYISLQDLMMDVLREKYLKEIDDLLNKYDAMNEADNKYLESLLKNLDRQRKLRDLEKNWNDLTNKERKLSLMLRDTSGGNLADVKNLLNEIEDLRTLLLDNAVDEIIEKLSEFYELQKESRDAEIQYKQTLIDDVNLLKEATEALEKILTSDDLVNWWKENVTGIEAFSKEKLDKLTQDWNDLFKAKSNYVASIDKTMLTSITETNGHLKDVSDEATHIVETTSEGITQLAEKSLEEAGNEYKEAVKKAKEALKDAVDAVLKLKEALLAAIDAANESKKAFDDLAEKYKELLAEKLKGMVTVITVGNNSYTELSAANRKSVELAQTGHGLEAILKTQKVSKDSAEYRTAVSNSETPKNVTVSANYSQTPAATLSDPWHKTSDKTLTFKKSDTLSTSRVYNQAQFLHEKKALKLDDVDDISVEVPKDVDHGVIFYDDKDKKWIFKRKYDSVSKAEEWIAELKPESIRSAADAKQFNIWQRYRAFAQGGLVNYTGPAWVDGSRSRPEAFLSSEDTRRIGEAARILADLPILSQPIKEQVPTTTIGDTTIQIDVHVDSIANDYDLDEAMNKVEQRIVNAAKYAGSNVILKKH